MPSVLRSLNSESRSRKERDIIAEVSARGRVYSCSSTLITERWDAKPEQHNSHVRSYHEIVSVGLQKYHHSLQDGCRARYAIKGIQKARWYSTKARSQIKKRVLKERNENQLLSLGVIDYLCFTTTRCWNTGHGKNISSYAYLWSACFSSPMHVWYNICIKFASHRANNSSIPTYGVPHKRAYFIRRHGSCVVRNSTAD